MASTSSISSTTDIASYVAQLVNLERSEGPEQYYTSEKNDLTLKTSTLTDLKTDLTALNTQVQALAQPGTLSPLATKAVSFSAAGIATATATASAANGTHTVQVTQLAKPSTILSNQLTANDTTLATTLGTGTQTVRMTVAGVNTDVSVAVSATDTNQTVLTNLASAINSAGADVTASVVMDTTSTARLVLVGKNSGAANAIGLQDLTGSLLSASGTNSSTMVSGTSGGALYANSALDAQFSADGLAITRGSNTVTDVVPGVTLTLTAAQAATDAPVSFTVAADTSAIQSKIQAFLDAYNTALKFLADRTSVTVTTDTSSDSSTSASDNVTVTRGSLADDFTYFGLRMNLRSDIGGQVRSAASGAPSTLAQIGITAASDGTLSISDTSKLTDALNSNPDGVVALFNAADGIATRVSNRLAGFVASGGTLDTDQQSVSDNITRLNRAIDEQEQLLKVRQEQLTQQYTALEETMAELQNQQDIVTQYLNSLSSSSSSS